MMPQEKLELLVLSTWAEDWQLEKVRGSPETAYLFQALRKRGFNLTVVAPRDKIRFQMKEGFKVFTIRVFSPPPLKFLSFLGSIVSYLGLNLGLFKMGKGLLKERDFHAILGFGHMTAPSTYLLSRKSRLPALLKIPGVVFLNSRLPLLKHLLLNWPFLVAFKIPFEKFLIVDDGSQGDRAARKLGVPEEKIVFLPNPRPDRPTQGQVRSDLKRELGLHENTPLLGWIGRLDPLKGVRMLPLILKRTASSVPEAHFLIVGCGPWKRRMDKALEPLRERIHMVGCLTYHQVQEILDSIDLLVSTNIYANYTLPVLECMDRGIPVVTWDIGDSWKAVRDGETGFLVSPWKVDLMVEKVTLLLEDRQLREKMGEKARRYSQENFPTWSERVAYEANLIREVVERWWKEKT